MEIPKHDTPTPRVIELGYGGEVDTLAVRECMDLLRVAKKCLSRFYLLFAEHGISPGKYSVLMELLAIDAGQTLQPSEIATRVGVSRPTITGLIDGLVRQNLVVRQPCETDRRKITVMLSPEGRAFMKAILPDQFAAMASLITHLDGGDRSALKRSLHQLEENLDAHR